MCAVCPASVRVVASAGVGDIIGTKTGRAVSCVGRMPLPQAIESVNVRSVCSVIAAVFAGG